MTPVIPYLLGLGRLIVEILAYVFAAVMIGACSTFVMGFICGLVFGAKDVPSWIQALAEKHAPQAKPEPEKVTVPPGITSNPRWPVGARH